MKVEVLNTRSLKLNERAKPLHNPLIVALDVDTRDEALRLADDLADVAGGFKLGPRLLVRFGGNLVHEISQRAPVFVDNKYFDIPSTMVAAVRASFEAGASLVTVHSLAGLEALTELAKLEKELNSIRSFRILAVTILTSWTEQSYPSILKELSIADAVKELGALVFQSGLGSIVCSPHEIENFSAAHDAFIVTPGIRFSLDNRGDQKRVMGPVEAIESGATAIVVGRPIIEAANPRSSATKYAMALFEKN